MKNFDTQNSGHGTATSGTTTVDVTWQRDGDVVIVSYGGAWLAAFDGATQNCPPGTQGTALLNHPAGVEGGGWKRQ